MLKKDIISPLGDMRVAVINKLTKVEHFWDFAIP